MNILETLGNQDKNTLKKVYLSLDPNVKAKEISLLKEDKLIQRIIDLELDESEIENALKAINPDYDKPKDEVNVDNKVVDIVSSRDLYSKAVSNQKEQLRRLADEMKRKALETVIVTLSPADNKNKVEGKDGEAVSIVNEYFSVAKIVPYNVPCEVPRCIAEYLKTAKRNVIKELTPDEARRTNKLSIRGIAPKYNVTIQEKINK